MKIPCNNCICLGICKAKTRDKFGYVTILSRSCNIFKESLRSTFKVKGSKKYQYFMKETVKLFNYNRP